MRLWIFCLVLNVLVVNTSQSFYANAPQDQISTANHKEWLRNIFNPTNPNNQPTDPDD